MRGLGEAASRGFWVTPKAPYGYRNVHIADRAKKRPKQEVESSEASVVRRMFSMADSGKSVLDSVKALDAGSKEWSKTAIPDALTNV